MEVMYARCAGLDVHKESVVATMRVAEQGKAQLETRTFGTSTSQLMKLSDWLMECGCTHVAMEATGIYWKPIWAVLEAAQAFELVLANARSVKALPGRKTDVKDSQWLADLLAHGLIAGSFVPPAHVQEMRDLSRTRKQLVQEVTAHTLRIQKLLESGNVKLSSILSDILGESGRAILDALAAGTTDPDKLAQLMNYRVKASPEHVREALRGTFSKNQQALLKIHLTLIDSLELAVRELEERLGDSLAPFREKLAQVIHIPGLQKRSASAILAETGFDMSRFRTADHLVSWAGLCPRMDESAGKRRDTRTGKRSQWLKPVLIQAALCAVRKKDSYLHRKYQRIRVRRGNKKALVAVAASILRTIWHLLSGDKPFTDLGIAYDAPDAQATARKLARRIEKLGFKVEYSLAA